MRPTRISLAGVLGLVACCAIGLACLLHASTPWAGMASSVGAASLPLGLIALIYRRHERRAFWVGFSICGWAYSLLIYTPWLSDSVGSHLVTTKLLRWSHPILILEGRRSTNPLNAGQSIHVPLPELEEGIDSQLTGVELIDIHAKGKNGEIASPLAEGIEFGTAKENGKLKGLYLQVDSSQFARVKQAIADGVKLVLKRHRSAPLAGAWSDPPVQLEDYLRVGHAFLGTLVALAGGVVGMYFYATRETTSANDTPRL